MTETAAVVSLIGNQATTVADDGQRLVYVWKADARVWIQAGFFVLVGGGGLFVVFQTFVVPLALGSTVLLVCVLNSLLITRLELDTARRWFRVRRGIVPLRSHTEGSLEDFHGIVLVPRDGAWHIALQPRGSGRAYDLASASGLEQARSACIQLSGRLGLTFLGDQAPPGQSVERFDDLTVPPSGSRLTVDPIPGGRRISLPRRAGWIECLHITQEKIGFGRRVTGRRADRVKSVPWADVRSIEIRTVMGGENATSRWHLKATWRDDAIRYWHWRLAELKRPAADPPWWWNAFFIASEFPCTPEKALTIEFAGRRPIRQIGDDSLLTPRDLAWLGVVLRDAQQRARR